MPRSTKSQGIHEMVNDWVKLVDPRTVEEKVHKWVGQGHDSPKPNKAKPAG